MTVPDWLPERFEMARYRVLSVCCQHAYAAGVRPRIGYAWLPSHFFSVLCWAAVSAGFLEYLRTGDYSVLDDYRNQLRLFERDRAWQEARGYLARNARGRLIRAGGAL